MTELDATTRADWLRANRRMTDAALGVARWVELHAAGVDRQPELRALLDEYKAARTAWVDRVEAPAPAPRPHLYLVR